MTHISVLAGRGIIIQWIAFACKIFCWQDEKTSGCFGVSERAQRMCWFLRWIRTRILWRINQEWNTNRFFIILCLFCPLEGAHSGTRCGGNKPPLLRRLQKYHFFYVHTSQTFLLLLPNNRACRKTPSICRRKQKAFFSFTSQLCLRETLLSKMFVTQTRLDARKHNKRETFQHSRATPALVSTQSVLLLDSKGLFIALSRLSGGCTNLYSFTRVSEPSYQFTIPPL